jgi:hypothetical protein
MKKIIANWKETSKHFQTATQIPDRLQYITLALILAVIAIVRILMINTPSLTWTAWKEIDYLYISQNFLQNGFNFFQPEVSWPAEPPHVTEMELPLVPYMTAMLYAVFGVQEYSARAVTLIAFILMIIYVFRLAKRELGALVGLLAALAAGIIPLYHPFGRFLFTEPMMIAMSVVSLYYTAEWVDYERRRDWFLAWLSISLTFSLKLESLYLLLPIGWIAYRKYRFHFRNYLRFASLILLSLILPILWYAYAYYLESVGAHLFGIFRGHDKSQTLTMLTDLRWYRTMAGRVINGILGGLYGLLLFGLGLTGALIFRKAGLFFAYLIAIGIYFILVAEGNVDAPYRQMSMIPVASVFIGLGAQYIVIAILSLLRTIGRSIEIQKRHQIMLLVASLIIVSLLPVQRYDNIIDKDGPVHWDRWELGEEIKKITDKSSKLIVVGEYSKHVGGYDLSPVLYYYTGLQGWSLTPEAWTLDRIQALRERGATHLVFVLPYGYPYDFIYLPEESNESFIQQVRSTYPLLFENQDQLVFDLR